MGASIKETIQATGNLSVVVTGPDGQVKDKQLFKNLVVDVGKDFIAARMLDTGIPGEMTHMAIGTGATGAGEAVGTDTALTTEVARVALATNVIKAGAGNEHIVQYTATFDAGTPATAEGITEAGIFNDGTAGTMLCRTTFAVVNKGTDDTLAITWEISIN